MKFDNTKQLYEFIVKLETFNNITRFYEDKIIITFHDDFTIEIKEKHYYAVYVNGYLYNEIESEEILDFLLEIINKQIAFVLDIQKKKIIQISYLKMDQYAKENNKMIYF